MRIITLLPAATEIVALLAPEWLVGVSHECDHPAWVGKLTRVTTTPIDVSASSARIDAQVRTAVEAGTPVIAMNARALGALRPDLIITQALCDVCAVADGEVFRLSQVLDPAPLVLALHARTIDGVLDDIRSVGRAVGRLDAADEVVAELRRRLRNVRARSMMNGERDATDLQRRTTRGPRPRVVCVEWLDPLYTAGHWVPEMIELAGGFDVGAVAGEHSRRREWNELAALKPDIVLVALCGFSEDRARREWEAGLPTEAQAALAGSPSVGLAGHAPTRLFFIDGNTYTSRPGPRLVDGIEIMADLFRT